MAYATISALDRTMGEVGDRASPEQIHDAVLMKFHGFRREIATSANSTIA